MDALGITSRSARAGDSEMFTQVMEDFKIFIAERTLSAPGRIKITLEDKEGAFQATGTGTNEKK